MDLSIVIVNWNTETLLRDCLRSVRAAIGALGVETFVVDNASSDGSAGRVIDLFGRLDHVAVVFNDRNTGFSRAVNQGAGIVRDGTP